MRIAFLSGLISSLIVLFIQYIFKKIIKTRIINIKLFIIIKDIQELLIYMENIITNRKINFQYYIENIDYKQVIIEYQELYKNNKMMFNLLNYYKIREKIKKEVLINDSIDYIKIKNIYEELETIFICDDLEKQIQDWEKNNGLEDKKFKFKTLKNLEIARKESLLEKIKVLKDQYNEIVKESGINIYDKKHKLRQDELEVLENINRNYIDAKCTQRKLNEYINSKTGVTNRYEALEYIQNILIEIDNIKFELGL